MCVMGVEGWWQGIWANEQNSILGFWVRQITSSSSQVHMTARPSIRRRDLNRMPGQGLTKIGSLHRRAEKAPH